MKRLAGLLLSALVSLQALAAQDEIPLRLP
jgi:hypothetical protein